MEMSEKHNMKNEIESKRQAFAEQVKVFSSLRTEFEEIKSEYVQALQIKKSMTEKSVSLQSEIEKLNSDIKQEFLSANGDSSTEVKKLKLRNDAQTMLEEIDSALININRSMLLIRMKRGESSGPIDSSRKGNGKGFCKFKDAGGYGRYSA